MKTILHQRYRRLAGGPVATLVDVRDDSVLLFDGAGYRIVPFLLFRLFWDLEVAA